MAVSVKSYTRNGKTVKAHTRGGSGKSSTKNGVSKRASGDSSKNFGARAGQLGGGRRTATGRLVNHPTIQESSRDKKSSGSGKGGNMPSRTRSANGRILSPLASSYASSSGRSFGKYRK